MPAIAVAFGVLKFARVIIRDHDQDAEPQRSAD
jgi:hypothetical protein